MRAVRDAEIAAESIGLAPVRVKTTAFAISALCAGVAGALFASLSGFVTPSTFAFSQSILFVLVVMIGGAGFVAGPLVGAAIVVLLPEFLAALAEYRLLFFGALLLFVLWLAPEGLVGSGLRMVSRRRRPRFSPSGNLQVAHATARRPERGKPRHFVRRRAGRARHLARSEARRSDQPHRPEWRGQDHGAQHAERLLSPRRRFDPHCERSIARHAGMAHRARRHRAHLPDDAALRLDERGREPGDCRRRGEPCGVRRLRRRPATRAPRTCRTSTSAWSRSRAPWR